MNLLFFQSHFHLHLKKEILIVLLLPFQIKLPNMKSRLTGLNHGVRQGNILNKDLGALPVPIPPLDLQNKFATFVQQIDKSKFVLQRQMVFLKMCDIIFA